MILIDLAAGKEVRRFGRTATELFGVAFSPDGKVLAAAGWRGSVHLWSTDTGAALGELSGHRGPVTGIAFLPDGRGLVSAGADSTALIWDLAGYLDTQRSPASPLPDEELRSLWRQLADDDPEAADGAADRLAAVPQQAVAMLRRELPPAPPVDMARIGRLVAELESNQFAVRHQVTVELEKLRRLGEPSLLKRLTEKPSLEARQRIEQLLMKLDQPLTDPAQLRALRAVELLERISTAEARAALRTLADGAPRTAPDPRRSRSLGKACERQQTLIRRRMDSFCRRDRALITASMPTVIAPRLPMMPTAIRPAKSAR